MELASVFESLGIERVPLAIQQSEEMDMDEIQHNGGSLIASTNKPGIASKFQCHNKISEIENIVDRVHTIFISKKTRE